MTPQTTGTRLSVSPTTLTFTTDNWDEAQDLTVTGGHDNDTDAETETLQLTASGGSYADALGQVEVTILDDDTLGVNISEKSLTITEGESQTYTVVLGQVPTGDVTVTVTAPSGSDLTVDSNSLTFTTSDWSVAQTVKVTALHDNDHLDEAAASITHSVSGGGYDSVSVDSVGVAVLDDDHPIVKTEFGGNDASAPEGTQVKVTITLDSPPGRTVQLPIGVTYSEGGSDDDHSAHPRQHHIRPQGHP